MENNESFSYTIHSFFSTELGLSGVEKEVFAIIFQDYEKGKNCISYSYFIKRVVTSKSSIIRALSSLEKKGLILKKEIIDSFNNTTNLFELNIPNIEKLRNDKKIKKPSFDKINSGFIYLLFCNETGLYKIGRTIDLTSRIKKLNSNYSKFKFITISTFYVDNNLLEAEKRIHKFYASNNLFSEMFDLSSFTNEQICQDIQTILNNL